MVLFLFCSQGIALGAEGAGDVALGMRAVGTFNNVNAITDGIVSTKKVAPATSNVVADSDQYMTVDLGKLFYIDRVRVLFDNTAYPRAFSIRTSSDGKYWEMEAENLDAASGVEDKANKVIALSVSCKRAMIGARYVQVVIPAGAAVSSGDRVKITEIEVFPAVGQKLAITEKNASIVTDKNAVISYRTTIGAVGGKVFCGTDPNALTLSFPNQESGIDNSATIYGLKAGTVYYYKVIATDLYGNSVESSTGNFVTLSANVASKKTVTGTFTELPLDPFVEKTKPVLSRVTDSSTDYFTSMATSQSLLDGDQYVVIDLGGNYSIKDIQTYWRKLAYPENYSVLLSQDNVSWTAAAEGLNAGSGAFSRSDSGDPMQVISVPLSNTSARYVKVLIKQGSPFFHKHTGWNFVQLMEVKVFAD